MLDLPCGDFSWMSRLNLPVEEYMGGDIVSRLVDENNKRFADSQKQFEVLDITKDRLPKSDLVLCRDCFVHFSFHDIEATLENIRQSSRKFLLTTSFTDCEVNEDIISGDWRVLNPEKPPFSFPRALATINEKCTEGNGAFSDKVLALWKVEDIPQRILTRKLG